MPTQFTPTRRVRFIHKGGWKGGVVVAEWHAWADSVRRMVRVRCPLTGEYFDVHESDCEDDGPRDDEVRRTT